MLPAEPWDTWRGRALVVGIGGLVAFGVFGGLHMALEHGSLMQFFLSYLTAFIFWGSVATGSVMMLLIQYLSGGRWGIFLRRPFEAATRTWPLLFVAFLPILLSFFMGEESHAQLYWWAGEKAHLENHPGKDIQWRLANYLYSEFVAGRAILYFAIFGVIIWTLNSLAKTADENPASGTRRRLTQLAGPFLVLFAITHTAMATDWVMSLEESWASTMFPVIYTANGFLSAYIFAVVIALKLSADPGSPLHGTINRQDRVNFGSFMLAFTMFWTYTNFSQFLLVWAGNLPEEIPYYLKRIREGWRWVGIALVLCHWLLPFLLLLFRDIKEYPHRLSRVGVGLMAFCALDTFWWIAPSHPHEGMYFYWLMDVAALVGLGGIWFWAFVGQLKSRNLVPLHDLKAWEAENGHH
jgi:hypothetical protein